MTDANGRKTNLRGTQEDDRLLLDTNSDSTLGRDVASDGATESERTDRTVCTGIVADSPARPRPATHGKTLSHLIRSVQSRVARNIRKIAQLEQEIRDLQEENEFEAVELEYLNTTLTAWNERVASLKDSSDQVEADPHKPAQEDLTA
ncbi:hypothetical protein AMR42_19105 [Limnothrix sp. PR1529]|uniref:hypothetical protein n=1 Tax=Limnothrix sp. PR1529 TaxID=1704291 RepID=UPI00081D7B2C|nr:hypothetical protein [Limnothrix sp. PR1529]OCQ93255.1 hypothetical protein BCR12_13215 [Limnothrix sp. P13C2]PIB03433.1 hypothetical protein AMR42_19105 [Limnothrix sp. PR1529]